MSARAWVCWGWTDVADVEIGHDARDRDGRSGHDDGGGNSECLEGVERGIEGVLGQWWR